METSERHLFLNIFNEIKQIYVFDDRGYLNYSLLDTINKNNKYFICRIQKYNIYR